MSEVALCAAGGALPSGDKPMTLPLQEAKVDISLVKSVE